MDLVIADNKVLWTIIPKSIIFRYVSDKNIKAEAKKLIKDGKICRSLYYKKDKNLKRTIYFVKNQMSYYQKYRKYFGNKGLHE